MIKTRDNRLCLAIDIGGTNLRFGLVDSDGTIVTRRRLPCKVDTGFAQFLGSLRKELTELTEGANGLGYSVESVGAGVPGLIDNDGTVLSSINLRPLEGRNIRNALEEISGMPVTVLNDANAAALGEARFGAGRGFSSLLHLTLGTGVGSGLLLGGVLWTGIDGVAAEYGHATVEPEGQPCPCGNRGCLEQYASATAIARLARERVARGEESILAEVAGGNPDSSQVASAALAGDQVALACFATAGRYLGLAAATAVNLLNLEAIIIGGGVAESYDLFEGHMRSEIASRAFSVPAGRVKLLRGELGDDAGLLGAAAAGWQLLTSP